MPPSLLCNISVQSVAGLEIPRMHAPAPLWDPQGFEAEDELLVWGSSRPASSSLMSHRCSLF